MRYYKIIQNGYVPVIGIGSGGIEITTEEYYSLLELIQNRPIATNGYDYRLKEDLTWEEYELPVIDVDEEEIGDSEALDIILGGGTQ